MKKLVLLSIGAAFALQSASAQTQTNVLFTTANDWSLWGGNGATVAVDPSFSSDNNTVNGIGNTGGGTGTGNGSLAITLTTSGSFNEIADMVPSEGGNQAFLSAIDPGQSGGVGVAYSGILQMTYSIPASGTFSSGTFFQLGVQMQYAPNYFQTSFGTTTDLGITDPNGNELFQATIPYSITAGPFNGFGFGVEMNSDYTGLAFPIYVDQIQTITPTPEPGTMALVGLSALGLTFFARRRRA